MRMVSWRVKRRVASCLTYYFDTFNQAPTGTNVTTVLLWMSVGLCTASVKTVAVLVISIVLLFWFDTVPHDLFVLFLLFFVFVSAFGKKQNKKENGVRLPGVGDVSCTVLCANIYIQDHFILIFLRRDLLLLVSELCKKFATSPQTQPKEDRARHRLAAFHSKQQQTHTLWRHTFPRVLSSTAPDTYHVSGSKWPGLLCLSFLMLSAIWSVSWMIYKVCMDVIKKYCEEYFF